MADEEIANALANSLVSLRDQLDRIEAHFAAAHVDAGIQALQRQFGIHPELTETD